MQLTTLLPLLYLVALQVRDKFGNPAESGTAVEASLLEGTTKWTMATSGLGGGNFTGRGTAVLAGVLELSVKVNGVHVAASPVQVHVQGGEVSTHSTLASGSGLTVATAGSAAVFTVRERDEHLNVPVDPSRGGGGSIGGYAAFLGDDTSVTITPEADSWHVRITPKTSGVRPLSVLRGGRHIPGSPFSLNVANSGVCATASILTGAGLTIATAGLSASFTVTSRDAYSNIVPSPSVVYTARVTGGPRDLPPGHVSVDSVGAGSFNVTTAGSRQLSVSIAEAGGLAATYYSDLLQASPIATETLSSTLDWSSAASSLPSWLGSRTPTAYSARWTGFIGGITGGTYTFTSTVVNSAQRVKLWVDNSLMVSCPMIQPRPISFCVFCLSDPRRPALLSAPPHFLPIVSSLWSVLRDIVEWRFRIASPCEKNRRMVRSNPNEHPLFPAPSSPLRLFFFSPF